MKMPSKSKGKAVKVVKPTKPLKAVKVKAANLTKAVAGKAATMVANKKTVLKKFIC